MQSRAAAEPCHPSARPPVSARGRARTVPSRAPDFLDRSRGNQYVSAYVIFETAPSDGREDSHGSYPGTRGARLRQPAAEAERAVDARRRHIYAEEKVAFEPRWFPVLYLLRGRQPMAVTEIAATLGVTHPAVNQIAAAMERKGLLVSSKDREGRSAEAPRPERQGEGLGPSPRAGLEGNRVGDAGPDRRGGARDPRRARADRDEPRSAEYRRPYPRRRPAREPDRVRIVPYARSLRRRVRRAQSRVARGVLRGRARRREVLADPEGRILGTRRPDPLRPPRWQAGRHRGPHPARCRRPSSSRRWR